MMKALMLLVGLTAAVAPAARADEAQVAAGRAAFATCAVCHSAEKGRIIVGPPLYGVVGRKAGSVADYTYSPANKNSGITWTPEKLFQYLQGPQRVVPGTKMAFSGIPDAQKRADVIAYLATLK